MWYLHRRALIDDAIRVPLALHPPLQDTCHAPDDRELSPLEVLLGCICHVIAHALFRHLMHLAATGICNHSKDVLEENHLEHPFARV